jgi:chromosome segregation ATPase
MDELHEELGKEVRINLENEVKIKRLERQQVRYEADIQYLYNIIEKLESQKKCDDKELQALRIQLVESHTKLKNSEKLCNKKEQFITFRESQLLEQEDEIYRLKQRISDLFKQKNGDMARVRDIITPLEGLSNAQLLGEIQTHSENLYTYAIGRTPNARTAQRSRDRIQNASDMLNRRLASENDRLTAENARLAHENVRLANEILEVRRNLEELEGNKDTLLNENAQFRTEIHIAKENLEGFKVEAESRLADLMNEILERDKIIRGLENNLRTLLEESERLETNCNRLIDGLQRNLDRARVDIDERDVLINRYRIALNDCQDEKDVAWARYMTEQLRTRSLIRQRLALKIANRQLQIRLMNPPVVIPPPIPQPVNQIWLLL